MRAFFDSNVIVDALAADDAARRAGALQLIARHVADKSFVISTQVLLETFNVLTRKKGAASADVLAALRLLAQHEVVAPDAQATLRALELAVGHKLSIWDALVVQAALEAGCDTLYSEDLQAGRRFGSLEVVNPFDLATREPVPAPRAGARAKPAAAAPTRGAAAKARRGR
ncbi:MAG: PIN domain-containing protein [Rubrivivax sp.]|nr:PIN domain-containing protein [Rubrivivax sp.]